MIQTATRVLERQSQLNPLVRVTCLYIAASLAVAAAARVAFPLPFTPVPFTLQPLAVLLVGLMLGPSLGAVAMVMYLFEGACGLPVFSPTGPGGIVQLLGPTGGFLLAYPTVAFVVGWLTRSWRARLGQFLSALAGGAVATTLLFVAGTSWLAMQLHLGWHEAIFAAVLPFLPGETVKIFAAAGLYRALQRFSSSLNAQTQR